MARIRDVEKILRAWDPIGVEPGTMAPADEYDSYAPRILSLIQSGCTVDSLADHLNHLETEVMGLKEARSHSLKYAEILIAELRDSGPDTAERRSH